jgi:TonB family protein
MSEAWKRWQGQVVDGKFPLRRYLGGSEYSAVFLTERGEPAQRVAIKFIQVDDAEADAQLSRWKRAAELSHPHLLRVFDSGRCRLGDFDLLYAVMEYAEENLAQFLPQRPLTPAEARDVLAPTLDALAYLHTEGLVHGHVRPSNIMAIEDCLKLTADGTSPIAEHPESSEPSGEGKPSAVRTSLRHKTPYDAPETADGEISPAADVWSLGMTLVEMLTQRLPLVETDSLPSIRPQDPQLPDTLPALFQDIAQHCLQRDPQRRWTVGEISARLNPTTPAPSVTLPEHTAAGATAPSAAAVKRALAQAEPFAQPLAAPRSETGYQPTAPARQPLHAQTVAARDSLSKPRYDLAPPRLKRPPLMPKSNYLVLGILVALALAAILVAPRILRHRHSSEQISSVEPKETLPSKPLQPAVRAKDRAKATQKPATPSSTQSAQASQRQAQIASPPAVHDKQSGGSQPASATKVAATPAAVRSEAAPLATPTNTALRSSSGAAPGEVLEQVLPEPSQKAQATIHGKVSVRVRVHVDAAGSVSGAEFDSPGPSKYFADLALQAARRWDFAPAKVDGHAVPSEWLIVFHFTPSGPKVFPTQSNP